MVIKEIKIKGELTKSPASAYTTNLIPEKSFKISGANRDIQETHTIVTKDNDKLLEFIFEDGTSWMCDAATMHEMFPEIISEKRDADESFEIPATISNNDSDRGFFGSAVLKMLNVFKKDAIPGGIHKIVERMEDRLMTVNNKLITFFKDIPLLIFKLINIFLISLAQLVSLAL